MLRRWLCLVGICFLLTGCSSVNDFFGHVESSLVDITNVDNSPTMTYDDLMDTMTVRARTQTTQAAEAIPATNNGYKWIPPVVQKVKMPPMVRNGVLIPMHEEYVIINDAAYMKEDNHGDTIRSRYRIPDDVEVVSPLKSSDVVVAIFRMRPVFRKSTVVPIGKAAFLLDGKVMDKVLALQNDELHEVGNYLCSFKRTSADSVSMSIAENGLREINTFSVGKSQMLFLSNGYILIPMFEKSYRRGD